MGKSIHFIVYLVFAVVFFAIGSPLLAQVVTPVDSTKVPSSGRGGNPAFIDSTGGKPIVSADTVLTDTTAIKKKKEKLGFTYHSPKKATWMSAALPSLGQFYNRRYWKPPIIYAGMGIAIYFLIDNQMKFIEARNSYRGRLNVPGFTVSSKYTDLSADQILADRDFYRTNRDYSIIAVAGVYVLNIIDAAVDAHLRTFDVSDDLSMKIKPSFQYSSVSAQHGFAPLPGMTWVLKF